MRKLLKGLILIFIIFILIRIGYDYKMVILNDDYITSYLDGTYKNSIPSKEDAVFDYAVCDDDVNVLWNDDVWGLMISNLRQKTKCNLYFQTIKNVTRPELYQGFIPVNYDDNGNVVISSEEDDWYDYENRKWANAVLVNCSDDSIKNKYFDSNMNLKSDMIGQIIDMNDILQMYVWIPRYRYKLWNAENGVSDEQMIDIIFESTERPKANGNKNGEYLTHPAFTFGDSELSGIWVGKFEMTGTTDLATIKPNLVSIKNINLYSKFMISRNIELTNNLLYGLNAIEINSHMMKNMDWGAVAYFTNSKYGRYIDKNNCIESGCEVWINNNASYVTGCSGTSVDSEASENDSCPTNFRWNENGVNASTTGNVFGIYDLSGCSYEAVMVFLIDGNQNKILYSDTGFNDDNIPLDKYFDKYTFLNRSSFEMYSLGDATKEVRSSTSSTWYNDTSYALWQNGPAMARGGSYLSGSRAGIFLSTNGSGKDYDDVSFRNIITKN